MQNREMTKHSSAFDKMTGGYSFLTFSHASLSNTSFIYFGILHSFIYRFPKNVKNFVNQQDVLNLLQLIELNKNDLYSGRRSAGPVR